MLYTVGYRGWTIWRRSDSENFRVSRTDSRDLPDLERTAEPVSFRDFASARREVDYLKRR